MGDVKQLNKNAPSLAERNVIKIIHDKRWAYISQNKLPPQYLIIGGNFWDALKNELNKKGNILRNAEPVQILDMLIVKVKWDCLEMGEQP